MPKLTVIIPEETDTDVCVQCGTEYIDGLFNMCKGCDWEANIYPLEDGLTDSVSYVQRFHNSCNPDFLNHAKNSIQTVLRRIKELESNLSEPI